VDQRDGLVELAKLLARRLARLSADSIWARRASGVRGGLLKAIDEVEAGGEEDQAARQRLDAVMRRGFEILEHGAREL
jgi:hypothetical protein